MSLKRIVLALGALAVLMPSNAQSTTQSTPQSGPGKSFEEYRKSVHSTFQGFRSSILENYAKYLKGVWDSYEQFKAEERDTTPKLEAIPEVVPEPEEDPIPEPEPVVEPTPAPEPEPVVEPAPAPEPEPVVEPAPAPEPEPVVEPKPEPQPRAKGDKTAVPKVDLLPVSPIAKGSLPDFPPAVYMPRPVKPVSPVIPDGEGFAFKFYDMMLQLPIIEFDIRNSINNLQEFGEQWEELSEQPKSKELIEALNDKAQELNLNDYLRYELAKSYVINKYSHVDQASQISLLHFLMANMGYDVRLATAANGTIPMVLISTQQMIYARPYLKIDDKKYFIFPYSDEQLSNSTRTIATCRLPSNADLGQNFDMRLKGLNLPYKAHPYNVQYGDMEIHGEVNGNLFPVVYRYPQMPISDYAQSMLAPDVRYDIVQQVEAQLKDMPQKDAVNKLLHFVQKGFAYETDGNAHGFEKPYFFEELLYYPVCDCEDRSVFFSYLLWNVLGVENHIINYPGHEAVSVKLDDPVKGKGYEFDNKIFNISDPTYIGSRTGMCMPRYSKTTPSVDYIYDK